MTGLTIIVATSSDESDDELAEFLLSKNIFIYRGSLNNVLSRFIGACELYSLDSCYRVTADNPLVDGELLMKEKKYFSEFDYVDNIHSQSVTIGTGFEFVTLKALKSIPQNNAYHLEHVTSFLRSEQTQFRTLRYIPDSPAIKDVFLTCDYVEDIKLLRIIYTFFLFRNNITIFELKKFFSHNPKLVWINKNKHKIPDY